MRQAVFFTFITSLFISGCATPISNNTVLEGEQSILMVCKSAPEATFILTEQVQTPSKEIVIVKTIPVPLQNDCTLVKEYDAQILLTDIQSNRMNKSDARVNVYYAELLPGNFMDNVKTGYVVKLTANAINYIGHAKFDIASKNEPNELFINRLEAAKDFLKSKGITKFPLILSQPEDNL